MSTSFLPRESLSQVPLLHQHPNHLPVPPPNKLPPPLPKHQPPPRNPRPPQRHHHHPRTTPEWDQVSLLIPIYRIPKLMHKVCSGHCTWQQNLEELILKTVFLVILLKKDKKIIEKLRSKVSSSESYWSEQSLNPSADCLTTKSRDWFKCIHVTRSVFLFIAIVPITPPAYLLASGFMNPANPGQSIPYQISFASDVQFNFKPPRPFRRRG